MSDSTLRKRPQHPVVDSTAVVDPLAGTSWSRPETVAGFVASPPNAMLVRFAQVELQRVGSGRALDLGCGAGRNAIPLAVRGWSVIGIDLSLPMLKAANERAARDHVKDRVLVALAPMDRLPVADRSCDLIIAHGIWNLAPSASMFRRAVLEAARVATVGAGLFVFTFSRHTLPPDTAPVADEPFVFTQFSGEPQCFLTETQLISELGAAGFVLDQAIGLREINHSGSGLLRTGGPPVIYEGTFRYRG